MNSSVLTSCDRRQTTANAKFRGKCDCNWIEFSAKLVRKLWARRLPKDVEISVRSMETADISQVLVVADNIREVVKRNANISEVAKPDKTYEALSKQIEALTKSINEIRASNNNQRSHSRERSRSSSRNRSVNDEAPEDPETCYYHKRFGTRARKCKPDCKFTKEN